MAGRSTTSTACNATAKPGGSGQGSAARGPAIRQYVARRAARGAGRAHRDDAAGETREPASRNSGWRSSTYVLWYNGLPLGSDPLPAEQDALTRIDVSDPAEPISHR